MNQKTKNEDLTRLSIDAFKTARKHPVIIVLDNVRSLNNVGSVFRTADAFLVEQVYLCGITGTPPNKEIEKTALGATASVRWQHFDTTLKALATLRAEGYTIYAVEQAENSISLENFKRGSGKTALIFGNEVYGVEQEVINGCDSTIEIPQLGTKHSLNISVSVGIVLWELLRGKLSGK